MSLSPRIEWYIKSATEDLSEVEDTLKRVDTNIKVFVNDDSVSDNEKEDLKSLVDNVETAINAVNDSQKDLADYLDSFNS